MMRSNKIPGTRFLKLTVPSADSEDLKSLSYFIGGNPTAALPVNYVYLFLTN
jgi:hypothetical protein